MWVQLKDQSTGGSHFQSLESTEGRRPRVVQKEWGGVSSFLAVLTLGLLFVDFRTFISLSGITFHHQIIEWLQSWWVHVCKEMRGARG